MNWRSVVALSILTGCAAQAPMEPVAPTREAKATPVAIVPPEPLPEPTPVPPPPTKPAFSCRETRPRREAEMKKRLDSVAHVNKLIDWEDDHCKTVDNSVPIIRTVQDSRGEYHQVEGRSRGVDFICDAKRPAEIAHRDPRKLYVYEVPPEVDKEIDYCKESDISAGDLGRAYWGLEEYK